MQNDSAASPCTTIISPYSYSAHFSARHIFRRINGFKSLKMECHDTCRSTTSTSYSVLSFGSVLRTLSNSSSTRSPNDFRNREAVCSTTSPDIIATNRIDASAAFMSFDEPATSSSSLLLRGASTRSERPRNRKKKHPRPALPETTRVDGVYQ